MYILVFLTVFSCNCMKKEAEEIVYPEGDIEEIRIYGTYKPKDPQRLEDRINEVIKEGKVKNKKEFKKKYPHFLDLGDESFQKDPDIFCYNKTLDNNKEVAFNKNLRVRLYDKEENIIAEDYLRVTHIDKENNWFFTVSYIPYHKEGYFFHVVRLEGKKEVILWKPGIRGAAIVSKAELIRLSKPLPQDFDNDYKYRPETKCHYDTFKIR